MNFSLKPNHRKVEQQHSISEMVKACQVFFNTSHFMQAYWVACCGREQYPDHRDQYGDSLFHKECIRALLAAGELSRALWEQNKYGIPEDKLTILFARYFASTRHCEISRLLYSKVLIREPDNQEASAAIGLPTQGDARINSAFPLMAVASSLTYVPTTEQRLEFYGGDSLKLGGGLLSPAHDLVIKDYIARNDVKREVQSCVYSYERLREEASEPSLLSAVYQRRLLQALDSNAVNQLGRFAFVMGDLPADHPIIPFPFLTKTRQHNSSFYGTILKTLNESRHWADFYELSSERLLNFASRRDCLVWRGATTGLGATNRGRFAFVEKFFHESNMFDVGFSEIVQGRNEYSPYLKWRLSIPEMCSYKYIISLEGNDKDSGLAWKLASGSVVIMPKPKSQSWIGEVFLLPWVHYIEMNDDFSDLHAIAEWCVGHQSECEEIAYNARVYMSQFLDSDTEALIEGSLICRFFSAEAADNSDNSDSAAAACMQAMELRDSARSLNAIRSKALFARSLCIDAAN